MAILHLGANRVLGSSTAGETPNYTTDFTASTGWTTTGTYSISSNELEGEGSQDEAPAGHGIFDLQHADALNGSNASDTSWVLRMKIHWTALSHTTDGKYAFIGISDNTSNNTVSEDMIGFKMGSYNSGGNNYRKYTAVNRAGSTSYVQGTPTSFRFSPDSTQWVEVIRDGSTVTFNVSTADDYTTGKETHTVAISGTINDLRYIQIQGNALSWGNDTGNMTFEVDDIKFYNGITDASLTDEKTTLVTPSSVPFSGSITSFVFDFDWYRGSSDTSDESNKNSNKIFVSTHNAGYSNSGQPSTSRQMGFMFSSGNNIGIQNWGSSGEAWSQLSGSVQADNTWRYFRMIFDDSANTHTWYRFANASDRDNMTVSSHTNSEAGMSASQDASTNFDTGDDLKYFVIESLPTNNASDWKLDNVKFWKNQETDSGDPDLHLTFADSTGWTNHASIGSITGGVFDVDTGHASTRAYYTIPDIPASSNLPENTIFIEKDTYKQYWLQSDATWMEQNPPMTYMVMAGKSGSPKDKIDRLTIATLGNATSFGTLNEGREKPTGLSNESRGLICGGEPSGMITDIESIMIGTGAQSADWGDLSEATQRAGGVNASTIDRGIVGGGIRTSANPSNVIDYLTIGTGGTALDFGNLTQARAWVAEAWSNTIGVFANGYTSTGVDTMDYITMATLGNATDFGDGTVGRYSSDGLTNKTRGVFCGGYSSSQLDTMDYITIDTPSNATDFGNLSDSAENSYAGGDLKNRGIIANSLLTVLTEIQYITIDTTGNSQTFGELDTCTNDGCSMNGI